MSNRIRLRKSVNRTSQKRAAGPLILEQLEDRLCPSNFEVIASGLDSPRGLTFGPDGQLYVAQGGPAANTLLTTSDPTVQQVPGPIGPYTGGYNSSIVRIDPSTGATTTVVKGLPSSQTSPASGNLVSGVASVQFIGNTLYGIEAGAGSSHGLLRSDSPVPRNPVYWDNTIFRVNPDGTVTMVADLSAFVKANPVAKPNADDFEPDGTWYSMVAVRGKLYAVEPNHGELDQITTDGQISRVLDFSAVYGHVVPTSVAYHGNFYVGNLGTFPINPHSEHIYQVTPSGQTQVAASGLTTVVGVAFDAQGRMYALESFTDSVSGFPDPTGQGKGDVVRINDDGSLTTIATGLTFPTAMTFGPDGNLYVSNNGFGVPDGLGEIVRINLSPDMNQLAQRPAVSEAIANRAIPFSPAPSSVSVLPSHLPPADSLQTLVGAEAAAVVDQLFTNLGAWLSSCTSVSGTLSESFNRGGVSSGTVAFNVGGIQVQGTEIFNLISSTTSSNGTNTNTGVRIIITEQGNLVLRDVSTFSNGQIAGTETILAGTGIFQGSAGETLSITGQLNADGTDTLTYSGCI